MSNQTHLTTEAGAPVADNQHSQTAGATGPVLLQDHHLLEKLARFNRERIPERVVHAVGSGAYGSFEVTNPDVSRYTLMKLFGAKGKRTEVFVRFSTVAGSKGAPDTARDPRGFAVRFYTEDGNWDVVGNNTPIFFLRDGIKFPDFIHSQKYDPFTNLQEPDNQWDFFSYSPEATHQFTWLFGDRGIPATLRHMDGFGSHTFQWVNAKGERFWVKFHFKTDQGIQTLTSEEAAAIGGKDPQHHQRDLYAAIQRGDYPSWTLKVQVMPEADAATYRFNPFDLTKVWPYKDYPLIEVGKMVLDRAPDNYFADVEQAALDPANFVPGIGPSPDRMLQARLFAYGDAARYRLGINHTRLPVNSPKGVTGGARNYGRDGGMRFDGNGGRSKNYEPNSFDGPAQTNEPTGLGVSVNGATGTYVPVRHAEDNDFVQAGNLYRLLSEDERERLVANIAGSLSQVSREDIITRSIAHFRNADEEYGARIAAAVHKLRQSR
ncbi:catalase [Vitiosangium sp. GDMCC 1.1324]|uniref:catalase n=1 Tax=Vitiosangium sp. (strain GDMCC 1.1324) TaxID=2138576 RepID=UPI000D370A32|nr:catalase [Vitiosangium sp. GDMCC 1.1324]PTL78501.1 catalase [Vitiosangium sp. GDMCC 1.1324]